MENVNFESVVEKRWSDA